MVTQPSFAPIMLMYFFEVAHSMNFLAASGCLDEEGMPSDQAQSQEPPLFHFSIGFCAKPILSETLERFGSKRNPAATVASFHIAHLPSDSSARFSLKPFPTTP